MFPIAHTWLVAEILDNASDAAVLGALFPDSCAFNSLSHRQSHAQGRELLEFLRQTGQQVDFGLGVVTHGIEPAGLDFYSDDQYQGLDKGYCFRQAAPLVDEVNACCSWPTAWGAWKAHNFIEMAVELYLAEKHPPVVDRLAKACGNFELISRIAPLAAGFYQVAPREIAVSLLRFVEPWRLPSVSTAILAQRYDQVTQARHGLKVDQEQAQRLIAKATTLVPDLDLFLDQALARVGELIGQLS